MPVSVSVIIVNWNSGNLLAECVKHVKVQTVQPAQILIVDNASSDNSLAGISEFGANIKLLRLNTNIGFSAANNFALSECDTDLIVLLNPDVFPAADWLERLVEAANNHPDVAAFGSRQLSQNDHDILDGTGDIYHVSGLAWRNRHGEKQHKRDLITREIFSPCAAAALYRRSVLNDVGGFDEDFFCYLEDVDIGFRMRLAGHKSLYVPEAVVYHVGSASTGDQWSDFAVYHGFRNVVWVFIKNIPSVLLWLLFPLHIMMNMSAILFFSMRGQGNVILKAMKNAMMGIPAMWKKRHPIQANRVISIGDVWRLLDKRILPPIHSYRQHIRSSSPRK